MFFVALSKSVTPTESSLTRLLNTRRNGMYEKRSRNTRFQEDFLSRCPAEKYILYGLVPTPNDALVFRRGWWRHDCEFQSKYLVFDWDFMLHHKSWVEFIISFVP